MAMVFTFITVAQDTKVNGSSITKKAKVKRIGKMEPPMLAATRKE